MLPQIALLAPAPVMTPPGSIHHNNYIRKYEGGREGGRDLLLAAGAYTAIEARSSSRADIAITVQQIATDH